jgi:hypothetical protein
LIEFAPPRQLKRSASYVDDMDASEVSRVVTDEISGNWSLSNTHGVDLKRCLVVPIKHDYRDSFNEGDVISLWLVLEEVPEDSSGYKIVFDETTRRFGLATGDAQRLEDVFLGFYGTFLETLEAM